MPEFALFILSGFFYVQIFRLETIFFSAALLSALLAQVNTGAATPLSALRNSLQRAIQPTLRGWIPDRSCSMGR